MRYVIASLVAVLLSAALFVYHWWVWFAVEKEVAKLPPEEVQVKLPKQVEEMLSWDDFLFGRSYILIPVFFVICIVVAWQTRPRLQVR